jgi:transposase-like protein
MPKVSKFTKEQKLDIVLDLITAKLSHAEVCRKYQSSSTYAYKLRDRALERLRQGIDHEVPRPSSREQDLILRVADLEQLAGDQALAIRALRRTKGWS